MSATSCQSNDSAMSLSEDEYCSSLSQASDDSPRAADWKRNDRKATAVVGSWSCLKSPGHTVAEAFDGKGNRIARQLSAVTGLTLQHVEETLNEVAPSGNSTTKSRWKILRHSLRLESEGSTFFTAADPW